MLITLNESLPNGMLFRIFVNQVSLKPTQKRLSFVGRGSVQKMLSSFIYYFILQRDNSEKCKSNVVNVRWSMLYGYPSYNYCAPCKVCNYKLLCASKLSREFMSRVDIIIVISCLWSNPSIFCVIWWLDPFYRVFDNDKHKVWAYCSDQKESMELKTGGKISLSLVHFDKYMSN